MELKRKSKIVSIIIGIILLVAVIIFLVPSFVKLLLSIANQVWVNISPDGCSIF